MATNKNDLTLCEAAARFCAADPPREQARELRAILRSGKLTATLLNDDLSVRVIPAEAWDDLVILAGRWEDSWTVVGGRTRKDLRGVRIHAAATFTPSHLAKRRCKEWLPTVWGTDTVENLKKAALEKFDGLSGNQFKAIRRELGMVKDSGRPKTSS